MAFAGLSTVLALGLAACSMPVKILEAKIPPEQYQDMNCDALNTERTRLLTERPDLNAPLLSSKTEAERDAEITQVIGSSTPSLRFSPTRAVLLWRISRRLRL